jgi:hypothetical protein
MMDQLVHAAASGGLFSECAAGLFRSPQPKFALALEGEDSSALRSRST